MYVVPRSVKRSSSQKAGFTLFETLMAVLFVGVVLSASFASISQSFRLVETSRDYTRVAQILQSQMEDSKMLSWEELDAIDSAAAGAWTQLSLGTEFTEFFGDRYQAWRLVQNRWSDGVELTDQKEITIRARWQDGSGNWNEKIMTAWFTKDGLHDYYYRSF